AGKPFHIDPAIEPVREESAHHRIADLELGHTRADRGHFPGAVGHRNALLCRPPYTTDHHIIVIVERTGAQPHADFTGCRGSMFGSADGYLVETATRLQEDRLVGHISLLKTELMQPCYLNRLRSSWSAPR